MRGPPGCGKGCERSGRNLPERRPRDGLRVSIDPANAVVHDLPPADSSLESVSIAGRSVGGEVIAIHLHRIFPEASNRGETQDDTWRARVSVDSDLRFAAGNGHRFDRRHVALEPREELNGRILPMLLTQGDRK